MLVIGLRNEGKWEKKNLGSWAMKTESSGKCFGAKKIDGKFVVMAI
jgi:hypothetical protein